MRIVGRAHAEAGLRRVMHWPSHRVPAAEFTTICPVARGDPG
jgi:hypothetical protein